MTEDGRLISVSRTTLGTTLAADASMGDGSVTLTDTSDFDEGGGSLQLAGSVYVYTTLDPDSGLTVLASTLIVGVSEGDRVDVWDTGLAAVAVDGRALVALPGGLANDEPVDADIAHNLLPFLDDGLRVPGTEEAVVMERRGDSWTVIDVRGKQPIIQPEFSAANVITGTQVDDTATSISSTIAGGGSSDAEAPNSVAIGETAATATAAVKAVAIGYGAFVSDLHSIAIGNNSFADTAAQETVVIGDGAQAQGSFAVAIGDSAQAGSDEAIAIGDSAHAQAVGQIAIGESAAGSSVTSTNAIAIGKNAETDNVDDIAIGNAARTDSSSPGTLGPGVAIGGGGFTYAGDGCTSVGSAANGSGVGSTAYGHNANADASDYTLALGANTHAGQPADGAPGAVAIGTDHTGAGASATTQDDFVLGTANHNVKVPGRLNVARHTPTSSADTQGAVGDITSDDSYVYVKTSTGWKRSALSTF